MDDVTACTTTPTRKTGRACRPYTAWVENEGVGCVLTKYTTPESALRSDQGRRVAEYGRAIRGEVGTRASVAPYNRREHRQLGARR